MEWTQIKEMLVGSWKFTRAITSSLVCLQKIHVSLSVMEFCTRIKEIYILRKQNCIEIKDFEKKDSHNLWIDLIYFKIREDFQLTNYVIITYFLIIFSLQYKVTKN